MTLRQITRLWSRIRPRSSPSAPAQVPLQDDAAGLGTAFGLEVSLAPPVTPEPEPAARSRAGGGRGQTGKPPRR